ncbi:hypothetical protein DV738_g4215, partial [Chaetothyriales sp. CBS 135597]
MSGKYSRDDLYKLRASPLICKPAKLADIEETLAAADVKAQRAPARRGADDASGAADGLLGRSPDSHRKSTTGITPTAMTITLPDTNPLTADPDRIVLGPPRRSFASSSAKGQRRGTAENGEDGQTVREKTGVGRFKDGDVDRSDKRINGRFSKHEPTDSTDEKPRRRVDNTQGDDRPRKDHDRKPKWAMDEADGDKDPKPDRTSRSKFEQSWLRPDRGAEALEETRRDGDRAHDWRGRKQERGWDRAAAVEDDPEWMDAPIDEAKHAPVRTQEDFQRWKEKMKAGKSGPTTEEKHTAPAAPSSPEPTVNKPARSIAAIPDAEPDDSMDKFLARFDKTNITSVKAAAAKPPTKTRFASFFGPSPDSLQQGGTTGFQPPVESQAQQAQYHHREIAAPTSTEPPVDPDQAGFARIMQMLKNRGNNQTPQNQEQKLKALMFPPGEGQPATDPELSQQRKLPLMAVFGRPQEGAEVPLPSAQDRIQKSRSPVDPQHAREPNEKSPSLLDLLKQANQAAKPTPPPPRYGNEVLMGPMNEAGMRDLANHSATYGNQMISPDPAILQHYARIENGRSPPLEDLSRRPANTEGQAAPDQLLNFVRGYSQGPKPANYQPHAPPLGMGRPPGLDTLGRPPPGWPGPASVPPLPQPQPRQPVPPPGMPGAARNLAPAHFAGPTIVQGQRPQPPRKYTGDFPPVPPPGFVGVPPPGFQGYGAPQGLPRPQYMDMHGNDGRSARGNIGMPGFR